MNKHRVSRDSRRIRSSQMINTYGPGAIFSTPGGESFVICTIDEWDEPGRKIDLKRLADRLTTDLSREIDHFRSPPSVGEEGSRPVHGQEVPALRFPRWLFCNHCLRMKFWQHADEQKLELFEKPICSGEDGDPCDGDMVPVLYVLACTSGHLQDVDWPFLVHRGSSSCTARDGLRWINDTDLGAGLKSQRLCCTKCDAAIALDDIYGSKAMSSGLKCRVKQPWQEDRRRDPGPGCSEIRVTHRAGQNLHHPLIQSALDIPPAAFQAASPLVKEEGFLRLVEMVRESSVSSSELRERNPDFQYELEDLALETDQTDDAILNILESEIQPGEMETSLMEGEWQALVEARQPHDGCDEPRFIVRKQQLPPAVQLPDGNLTPLLKYIRHLRVVERLREVRAITHFERIKDQVSTGEEQDTDHFVAVDLGAEERVWLPASEVYGEGIFIDLDPEVLGNWWREHGRKVRDRFERFLPGSQQPESPFVEARFRIVHTLSHLLIRALSHSCGYGATALSERLYVAAGIRSDIPDDQEMAAFLVYTTSGDLDGSMGGLAREGRPERLLPAIGEALESALWCSTDPICSHTSQGRDGANLGACRACTLLPETSCSNFNVQLDRQLLIDPEFGFMKDVVAVEG